MDDILRRLGTVETWVGDLKMQMASIVATLPHLATAKSVSDLRTEVADLKTELKGDNSELRTELKGDIAGLRTEMADLKTELKGDIAGLRSELKGDIAGFRSELSRIAAIIPYLATAESVAASDAKMIRWFIGTAMTLTTLAFSIAKFVH